MTNSNQKRSRPDDAGRSRKAARSWLAHIPPAARLPLFAAAFVFCIAFGQVLARHSYLPGDITFGYTRGEAIPPVTQRLHTSLSGSFLQFSPPVDRSGDAELAADVRAMHDAGMDTLIYQVSVDWLGTPETITQTLAWYPSTIYPRATILPAHDSLGTILDQAQALNMKVIVGLGYNQHFEAQANRTSPAYLDKAARQAIATADELWALYGKHPAFAGWYLPNEIGDFYWTTPEEGHLLAMHYLAPVAAHCRQLGNAGGKPNLPVAIGPYFGKVLSPEQFEAWWDAVLGEAGIDIVILQDGIGTGRIQFADLPPYFAAMQRACAAHNVTLWAYLELFQQTHGWPIDNQPWDAQAATIERVQAQMAIEQEYATTLIGQDVPRFMNPNRPDSPYAPGAPNLYAAYRQLVRSGTR